MEEMYLKKSSTSPNSKNCSLLSSSPVEEVSPNMMERPGIFSILGSDDSRGSKPAEATSFRRTLSADMSSKTWLAQNGFKHPAMKKIASSDQLAIMSVLRAENNKKQDDVWGMIISQKKSDEVELPPPYVHPLLKKSNSALSEKSLEICTENLGSETGSDGFSYLSSEVNSEASDFDKEEESRQEDVKNYLGEELPVVAKYNYSAAADKKMMQKHRSFPPPLSSLTRSSNEGPCLHMHSQRVNGRLVLQAVAVPSTKNFQAQREDGRLRLTLLTTTPEEKEDEEHPVAVVDQKEDDKQVEKDLEEMFGIFKEENGNNVQTDDREQEEMGGQVEEESVMKLQVPKMKSGTINVHRSALMMKKPLAIENQNSRWSDNFNYKTPAKEVEDAMTKETSLFPQSLPPLPRATRLMPGTQAATATAASYNCYEYFWRGNPATRSLNKELPQPVTTILTKQLTRPATTNLKNQLTRHCSPYRNNTTNGMITVLKPKEYEQKEIMVLRNCKEARKSLLFWDARCIATS
ncbi:protein FAF-like, chloroplastic [Apium graveolens]|uniref:protein FAF-like, chloroplastic n=1 Tax=Apium graveolens TaxID=4045 RepID=UPI003D78BF8B